MKVNILVLIAFLILAAAIAAARYLPKIKADKQPKTENSSQNILKIGKCEFLIEVADTPQKRQDGLSYRNSLEENHGMLFLFNEYGRYGFWMKEMNFNLDIVWIKDNKVTDLSPNVPTPTSTHIPTVQPKTEVNKVLEINAGQIKACEIEVGSEVQITLNN